MIKLRSYSLLTLLALVLIFPLMTAHAQASGTSLKLDPPDITAFPQVTLRLNAWDASGLPLTGLGPQDFTLSENGGAGFHPEMAQMDTQAPLGVALVLDISGSMNGAPLEDAKAAAARFLDRLQPGDQAALLAFSSPVNPDPAVLDASRELGFSTDLVPIYNRIEGLQSGGNTELYHAVAKAVRLTDALPKGHRAILLLSDGRNEPEDAGDPEEAIQLAREANLPVFVIGLGDQIDSAYLQRLASETGGLFRAAPASSELARLFSETATLLKTQYLLTYQSKLAPDGLSHNLQVKQGETSASLKFGPLPAAPPATPTPTPTEVPPTATESPAQAVPTPVDFNVSASPLPSEHMPWWGWPLAAVIALSLGLLFAFRPRKRQGTPTLTRLSCASCGYDLTPIDGPCPNCGSTKRLPSKVGKSK